MKTVKEIKEMAAKWHAGDAPFMNTMLGIFDALIGITEHLEAQPVGKFPGPITSDMFDAPDPVYTPEQVNFIKRAARIEAFKAAQEAASLTSDMHFLRQRLAITIARLENGGVS